MATVIPGRAEGAGLRVTLAAAATHTTAETKTFDAVDGLGSFRQAQVQLALTDAAAAAGDTLDVYVDTSADGGTSWQNVVHFTQVLGDGADAITEVATLDPAGAAGTDVVATTSDAASGKVRPSMFGDRLRVRHVLVDGGAHGQSFTYGVVALLK